MMEVTRLTKDELLYEVGVRGSKLSPSSAKVKDLRTLLGRLLKEELKGEGLEDALLPVVVEEEVAILGCKLEEASSMLEVIKESKGKPEEVVSESIRLRTLTSHCNRRLVRLLSNASQEEKKSVKPLFVILKDLVKEFRECGEEPVYAASTVMTVSSASEATGTRNSKSKSKSKHSSGSESEDEEGRRKEKPERGRVPKDVHKWNIHFSGEENQNVLSFIMDVEEKAKWKCIDLNCLIACASEFFKGDAKTWYRSVKAKIDSWEEMKIALRKEYLPLDYYDNLWDEIRARKQGQNESVGTYIANMIALFDRLEMVEPVHEEVMLKTMIKNLAPFYTEHLALTPVLSIDQLKALGKKLEVSKLRVETYEGRKGRKVEPEFVAKGNRVRKPTVSEVVSDKPEVPKEPKVEDTKPPLSPVVTKCKCFRCGESGHKFKECKVVNGKRFCYRCGMKDETAKTCPRCKRRGEGQ